MKFSYSFILNRVHIENWSFSQIPFPFAPCPLTYSSFRLGRPYLDLRQEDGAFKDSNAIRDTAPPEGKGKKSLGCVLFN
ncbi:hypothetical protein [Myxosarcina sp. GI1(2024)]